MSNAAPMRNVKRMLGGMGAMVKHRSKTIAKIGSTAFRVSENFSWNLERVDCNLCISFPKYFGEMPYEDINIVSTTSIA